MLFFDKYMSVTMFVKLKDGLSSEGDIGLAQPGLPGGAFGASLQGPGKEVAGGPASRRTGSSGITCVSTA